jgi:integrase
LPKRQGTIPDHKLAAWYKAVLNLGNPTAKDYYLFLLFTGLRRNAAAQLEWRDIDLEAKTLTIRADNSKGWNEFRLPLSTFVFDLLSRRHAEKNGSQYVFPGYRGTGRYYGCYATLRKLRIESGCNFIIHDIRRTTLTLAERLDTPHYALKKLAGHSLREDVTSGYLIIDVERLREPMQKIADRFVELIERDTKSVRSVTEVSADCWQVAISS